MLHSVGSPLLWGVFLTVVVVGLLLDLGLFRKSDRVVRSREALAWTIAWFSLAMLFALSVWLRIGSRSAVEFVTGYLIELALSVDNLFVFLMVFSFFRVPPAYQHRILVWGIIGALVMRAIFILAGAALISAFHWVLYVFGAFLIFTGGKILLQREEQQNPEHNLIFRVMRKLIRTTPEYHGARFAVRIEGRWYATPPLLVLMIIEATDLVFALDSIPAIFGVTTDAFIVYTSNIFAILGLRNLFFLLAAIMDKFRYLKIGLGLVLVFIGLKMVGSHYVKVATGWSLAVVVLLLGGSVLASILIKQRPR